MIPLRTDRPLRTTPWVNFTILTVNVLIFVVENMLSPEQQFWIGANFMQWPQTSTYVNDPLTSPAQPHLYQFFTSVFLHGDHWHLAGNMLFLWIFGNLVEDKLGHVRYLLFYLTGGIFAGLAHCLSSTNPALGASGAIAAVTGAFLVLFPRTNVRVLWLFLLISIIEIPSIWFIGIVIAKNLLGLLGGASGIAIVAHLGGYAFGIIFAFILLGFKIYPREPYDLVSLLKHWNRRRQFQVVTRRGYDPFGDRRPDKSSAFKDSQKRNAGKSENAASVPTTDRPTMDQAPKPPMHVEQLDPDQARQADLRQSIHQDLATGKMAEATQKFRTLIAEVPNTIMGESDQLALANQFFAQQEHVLAERMYRALLDSFPGTDPRGEVRLMLGLTLLRYLNQATEAKGYLEEAIKRLPVGENRTLAESMLGEIPSSEEPE